MTQYSRGSGTLYALGLAMAILASPSALGEGRSLVGTPQIQPELRISYSLDSLAKPGIDLYRPADLWSRVRDGFSLEEVNPELVRVHEQWFQQHPAYLRRALERSRFYLYHIVDEVQKRGMPTEIALLPIIESAFNPQAESPQKASGIWQFIPSTGRVYGLKQTAWYDGRRDVLEATRAALDYLEDLYAMFGRWDLALGAYNCGEGCMARSLGRKGVKSGTVHYASLSLPTETRHYVPKLVAVRNIIRDPERYGIVLEDMANEPYFTQVSLNRHLEAQQVARLADMSLHDVLSLNPGFQRKIIRSDHTGVLLLPTDRVDTFTANLKRQEASVSLSPYSARKGESLRAIADKFGVTLDWLKSHNPLNLFKGKLTEPATVLVPNRTPAKVSSAAGKSDVRTHLVSRGDTLERLAERYQVLATDISRLNNAAADPLKPGVLLSIPLANS